MRVTIIGSGYVGLVTGACFAEFGHYITCVDKDSQKIQKLKDGISPIYEPGLDDLIQQGRKAGRLNFTTDLKMALKEADAVFLAVGTPSHSETGAANVDYIFEAAREVATHLDHYCVIVTKSTVPVGTARQLVNIIRETNPSLDFDVASNPEFLREGAAIHDFMRPDRVVIGTESSRAQEILKQLYRPLYLIETPIVFTNIESAEIAKYAANAFLATKVAFINEMADLCEATGGDIQDVAKAMGLDGRIGKKFLNAGPGFGGSCFPKDTRALVHIAEQAGTPSKIVDAVMKSNEFRKQNMVSKIMSALGGDVAGKKIAILGLTFKPNTDDMREAPSLVIIPALQKAGATIYAYDPIGHTQAQHLLKNVIYGSDPYTTVEGVDAIVLLTEWNEFRAMNLQKMAKMVKQRLFIDLRNVYKAEEALAAGFHYISIGRSSVGVRSVPKLSVV